MIDKDGNLFYIDSVMNKHVIANLGFKACGDAFYFQKKIFVKSSTDKKLYTYDVMSKKC